jgi:glucose-1-phosphate adenylyltransferase
VRYPIDKAAGRFGIIQRDEDGKVIGFEEKPEKPAPIPGDESRTWVSMGNYIFDRQVLVGALEHDSHLSDSQSSHDFGRDVIPRLIRAEGLRVHACDFTDFAGAKDRDGNLLPGYWRDMGSVDSYYEAGMDLVGERPIFDLYDKSWPIYSINTDNLPPPKFFAAPYGEEPSVCFSILSDGCVLKGCRISNSVLSPEVVVEPGSTVRNSIILDNVKIGKNCLIDRAIIDKNVWVPDGTVIFSGRINLSKELTSGRKKVRKGPEAEYTKELERLADIFIDLSSKSHTTASGIVVVPRYYDVIFEAAPAQPEPCAAG